MYLIKLHAEMFRVFRWFILMHCWFIIMICVLIFSFCESKYWINIQEKTPILSFILRDLISLWHPVVVLGDISWINSYFYFILGWYCDHLEVPSAERANALPRGHPKGRHRRWKDRWVALDPRRCTNNIRFLNEILKIISQNSEENVR